LVAEIGASFACAELGITPELRDDHVQYVASWLKILKEDKRAIFTASAAAAHAVEYLQSLQRLTINVSLLARCAEFLIADISK
jgi:antirestriction protein ArdC